MKMQCSALPFGIWTGVLFASRGVAPEGGGLGEEGAAFHKWIQFAVQTDTFKA